MSDPPDSSRPEKKPGQRNSPDPLASEADFWDLDEEVEEAAAPTPAPEEAPEPEEAPAEDPVEEAAPDEPVPAAGEENASPEPKKVPLTAGLSKPEKTAILAVGACLLLGAIWALGLFFKHVPTGTPDDDLDYPIKGKVVTITSAKTSWREPDPETDRGIRPSVKLIPAARIQLGAGTSGAVRLLFRDDADDIVGDPITLAITDGRLADGANEIIVNATDGFSDEGDHAAYVTEQIEKWHLQVTEGPDVNASGRDFDEVCRIPISKTRQ